MLIKVLHSNSGEKDKFYFSFVALPPPFFLIFLNNVTLSTKYDSYPFLRRDAV